MDRLGSVFIPSDYLLGRSNERNLLTQALQNHAVKVIAVTGERGVGKTTLVAHIFAFQRDHGYEFDYCYSLSNHGQDWSKILDSIYRLICPSTTKRITLINLMHSILSTVDGQSKRLLLYLDNVEADVLREENFLLFLQSWIAADHRSTIMLTSREDAMLQSMEHLVVLQIEGLREPSAILKILGESLRTTFDDETLLAAAHELRDIPQKLLYLQWLKPATNTALLHGIKLLESDATTEPLKKTLSSLSASCDHFIAIGMLRVVEFKHNLLKFFWDELALGNVEKYEDLTRELVEYRLLLPPTSLENDLRVHPDVHLDLKRLAEERGRRWISQIHSIALNYYKERIDLSLDFRGEFIYHALALQKYDIAYAVVFEGRAREKWHDLGLAQQLESLLLLLHAASNNYTGIERVEILVELSQIYSDLSRHTRCLHYLSEALSIIESEQKGVEKGRLQSIILKLLAISYGDLGNMSESIYHYIKAIELDPDVNDPQTALCMGYVGYVYCNIMKFDEAHEWTQLALKHCPKDLNPSIFAKNLCNRGLVLYYTGQIDLARTYLEQALNLVSDPSSVAADTREHGRILIYLGTVYLAQPDVLLQTSEETFLRKTF